MVGYDPVEVVEQRFRQLEEELLFRLEVIDESGLAEAGRRGQVPDGRTLVAPVDERLERCVEEVRSPGPFR